MPRHQWKKGESGNPRGITEAEAQARVRIRDILAAAAPSAAKRLRELIANQDPKVALAAATYILDRILGKATQPVKHEAGDTLPPTLTPEESATLQRVAEKLLVEETPREQPGVH